MKASATLVKSVEKCSRRVSQKCIWIMFIGLFFFVGMSILSTSSRLSVIVDVSMKMKTGMLNMMDVLLDLDRVVYTNATVRLHTYKSKAEADKAYKLWKENHPGTLQFNMTNVSFQVRSQMKNNMSHVIVKSNTSSPSRSSSCDNCFKHNFKYLINNEDICATGANGRSGDISVMIFILTTHSNRAARDAIRSTWLNASKDNTGTVRHAFLLGYIPNEAAARQVVSENEKYHDIIKEDFVDSYQNLTYKTIMAYKWATHFCNKAACVMKTDDDMFLNVPNLIQLCNSKRQILQKTVFGSCAKIAAPIRNKKSKWYASVSSYPDKRYPGFCSGTGYLTSLNVASKVYEVSASIPFFHLEDIYVALCIKKLGFNVQKIPGFNAGRPKTDPCLYHGHSLLTAHRLTPMLLSLIWNKKCVRSYIPVPRIPPKKNSTSRQLPYH